MVDINAVATQTHCGQYKKYDDFYRVWEIETQSDDAAEVLEWCFENLYKRRVPESAEWHKNIRYGSGHDGGANYYFAGYYSLNKMEHGYKFTICEPYTD